MIGQRPRRIRRWLWYTAGGIFVAGGLAAVLAFSSVVRITDVRVDGARSVGEEDIRARFLSASLLTLNTGRSAQNLKDEFPQVLDAVVTREWPHRVSVAITERSPRGIWCRRTVAGADDFMCRFWDDHGVRWGTVVPSTGPLLLQVRDERSDDSLDEQLFDGLLAAVDGLTDLGLRARKVTLPDAEPGGMRIALDKGYELYLDALTDMTEQLDTLGVFLTERAKDPAFQPSYIDLRTPGRIYYK